MTGMVCGIQVTGIDNTLINAEESKKIEDKRSAADIE